MPATAPAAEPKVTIAAPATETKLSANPAAETKAAEPVIEPKITNTDTVKSCPSNAGDDRKGDCDSGQAQKPGIVQAKTDVPAAVVAPPVQYRVPAAIAFERAPLIAHPQAKAPSGNKVPAKEGETKIDRKCGVRRSKPRFLQPRRLRPMARGLPQRRLRRPRQRRPPQRLRLLP